MTDTKGTKTHNTTVVQVTDSTVTHARPPSPQDTVVALQALALYESHQHQGPLSVTASVTATGLTHSFSVTDDNKLLQQLVPLPTLPTNVTIGMEGQGCAVLQVRPPCLRVGSTKHILLATPHGATLPHAHLHVAC